MMSRAEAYSTAERMAYATVGAATATFTTHWTPVIFGTVTLLTFGVGYIASRRKRPSTGG